MRIVRYCLSLFCPSFARFSRFSPAYDLPTVGGTPLFPPTPCYCYPRISHTFYLVFHFKVPGLAVYPSARSLCRTTSRLSPAMRSSPDTHPAI